MSNLAFVDTETTGLDPSKHLMWEIAIITDSGEYCWVLELQAEELGAAEPMALTVGQYYERATAARDADENKQRFSMGGMTYGGDTPKQERQAMMQKETYIRVKQRGILAEFLAYELDGKHLVGAVPSFDANFLNKFMREYNFPPTWHYHLVDVEALAAGALKKEPPWKSRDLYLELGVTDEPFPAHTALGDARLARAVYEKALGLPLTESAAEISILEEARPETVA